MSLRRPDNFDDVADALARGARIIAGGTGLQPELNGFGRMSTELVSLSGIAEAWELREPEAGRLRVGAMVPLCRLGSFGLSPRWFATPAVRRRATLVGNLMHTAGLRELAPLVIACRGEFHWCHSSGRGSGTVEHLMSPVVVTAVEISIPDNLIHHRAAVRATLARPRCAVTLAAFGGDLRVITSGTGLCTTVVTGLDTDMTALDFADAVVTSTDCVEPDLLAVLARRAHDDYRRASWTRVG